MFPVVQELAADGVPVAVTCRVLNVSTSGYYEWRSRPASERDVEQAYLMHAIREVHAASYGTYGHRRVHAELTMGRRLEVSHGRVERLMRSTGLQGVHRRRLRGCTRRDEAATPSADLVERRFTPDGPNRLYVADVTQHRTSEGWLYYAVVIDCFSRRVVGWSMQNRQTTDLVLQALLMAVWRRKPKGKVLIHSDQGSQFTSMDWASFLKAHNPEHSMSRRGNCHDNAVVASFFNLLKREYIRRRTYRSRDEARQDVFDYIEMFYNLIRKHVRNGMLSPVEFERQQMMSTEGV